LRKGDLRDFFKEAVSMTQGETLHSLFGEVIHSYSRADALRDGVLVELPADLCREAGVIVPVAVSAEVWHLIDPGNLDQMPGQSITGRTWDLLWMFSNAARASCGRHRSTVVFRCTFLICREALRGTEIIERKTVTFRAICCPGDQGEPVITIMLPWED
jgi:hypothetical protein